MPGVGLVAVVAGTRVASMGMRGMRGVRVRPPSVMLVPDLGILVTARTMIMRVRAVGMRVRLGRPMRVTRRSRRMLLMRMPLMSITLPVGVLVRSGGRIVRVRTMGMRVRLAGRMEVVLRRCLPMTLLPRRITDFQIVDRRELLILPVAHAVGMGDQRHWLEVRKLVALARLGVTALVPRGVMATRHCSVG